MSTDRFENSCRNHAIPPDARLIVADWEGGKIGWRVVPEGEEELHLSRDEMLAGKFWTDSPCVLIIEFAHLHERRPLSVAQVYDAQELEELHALAVESKVDIRAFPQRLTKRARIEGGFGDDKEQDPKAVAAFVRRWPEVTLKRWAPYSEEEIALHETLTEIRFDGTVRLNEMRPDYEHPDVDRVKEMLPRIYEALSDGAREQFGLEMRKDGKGFKGKPKWPQIMSLYVAAFDADGNLRRNPHGQFIGIEFIWSKLLLMSPYHGRSGTARSNLMFWGLRPYDNKRNPKRTNAYTETREQHYARRERWSQWRRHCKEMLRSLRDCAGS